MMMAIQKYCCPVSKLFVGVWDGLNECEISRPEILFQSAPDTSMAITQALDTHTCLNFRGFVVERREL